MLYGLQAGFQNNLGNDLLQQIKNDLLFDGVRLDCQDMTAMRRAELIKEATDNGLIPMVIVRDATQMDGIPEGTNIEIRSEPDIWSSKEFGIEPFNDTRVTPDNYRKMIDAAYIEAKRRNLILWAGTVSNFNVRGLDFLAALKPREWPPDLPVSIHWYPHRDPETPHPGFNSRGHELAVFKNIIGDRSWGISEFGYNTAKFRYFFNLFSAQWTDQQVAQFTVFEWEFWRNARASFAIIYQLNDGTTSDAGSHYGIRYLDGLWKPVAHTVKQVK